MDDEEIEVQRRDLLYATQKVCRLEAPGEAPPIANSTGNVGRPSYRAQLSPNVAGDANEIYAHDLFDLRLRMTATVQ